MQMPASQSGCGEARRDLSMAKQGETLRPDDSVNQTERDQLGRSGLWIGGARACPAITDTGSA